MGGHNVEALQKQFDDACKPILTRCQYYATVTVNIRRTLLTHFFDSTITSTLTETAQSDQLVFDFNQVRESMQACLVDEQTLFQIANGIKEEYSLDKINLVRALDANVLNSGLPFILQDNKYAFSPEKPYTANAQTFMQQFAYALSAYRISLGICEVYEVYFNTKNHPCLNVNEHREGIALANHLKQNLEESGKEFDLITLWQQAKGIKNKMNELLKAVHEFPPSFETEIQLEAAKLSELFHHGAHHLQEGYKKFPNSSKLSWLIFDASWQALLKNIAGSLYSEQYSYSTLYGTLAINLDFIKTLNTEITQFYTTTLEKLPLLKIELLEAAYEAVNKSIVKIKMHAAKNKIELIKAPEVSIFNVEENSIYYQLSALYRQKFGSTVVPSWETTNSPEGFINDGIYGNTVP